MDRGRIARWYRSRWPAAPRAALAALAALLALPFAAAPAVAAAPSWLPPGDLSAPLRPANTPKVAMGDSGETVVIWERKGFAPFEVPDPIQVSTRAPGGAFSAPVNVAARAHRPEVAMTPGGEAVAAWWRTTPDGTTYVLEAATRPPGGGFSAPTAVAAVKSGTSHPQLALAVNSDGDAVLAWRNRELVEPTEEEQEAGAEAETVRFVEASVRQAGGVFSAPERVSPEPELGKEVFEPPSAAIDGAGNAIVAWSYGGFVNVEPPEVELGIEAAYRSAGGAGFGVPEQVTDPEGNAASVLVEMDAAGNALAVWRELEEEETVLRSASRGPGPGAGFSAPTDLSQAGNAEEPDLEMAAAGRAAVIWVQRQGGVAFVQARFREPGGGFGPLQQLTPAGEETIEALYPSVALGASGDVAIWRGRSAGGAVVKGAVGPAGGPLSSAQAISASGVGPVRLDVAIDAEGNATAVWHRTNAPDAIVQQAGYDAAAARIRGLSVPASGTVGEPVPMAVDASDAWPLRGAGWAFGDGGFAAGPSVAHAFGAPGVYPVSATVTDASGTQVTAGSAIRIEPSYEFSIGKRKRNRRRGIVVLRVRVSGPGTVGLAGRKVRRQRRAAQAAGQVRVPVIARGRALRGLRRRGKARVAARVSFAPRGGTRAVSRRVVVVLVKRARKGKRRAAGGKRRAAGRHRAGRR